MTTDVVLHRLGPDDWAAARDVRLAAVHDAPEAFASTLERELSLPEQSWRARLSGGAWFVAHRGSLAVGLACGVPTSGADARQLVGMWVAPASRGAGVGDALVAAVLRWAAGEGATRVELWVVDSNVPAIALYRRRGFEPTGKTQPLPSNPRLSEIEMALDRPWTSF